MTTGIRIMLAGALFVQASCFSGAALAPGLRRGVQRCRISAAPPRAGAGLRMSGEDGKGEDMQDTLKAMGGPETPVLTEEELAFIEVQNKLFVAAEDGDVEGIKSALEAGADVNVQQEDEALSRTMLTTINEGLLGPSALHLAAMFGHVSAVEEILESDAKIDCVTAEGNTPLHLAIISKQQDVVNVLVSKGADVERPNEVGAPATELAEMMGIEIEQ